MNPGVLGVVLAGGRSARFGADKALVMLDGKTLLERVCERAAPQVDRLLINRNGSTSNRLAAEYAMLPDEYPSQGPLAGILSALAYAQVHGYSLVATFPCDTPFLPADLVSRLSKECARDDVDLCIARRGSEEHFVLSLWKTKCRSALAQAFGGGLRSIRSASRVISTIAVDFPLEANAPDGDAFFNVNTTRDLVRAESWLIQRQQASQKNL